MKTLVFDIGGTNIRFAVAIGKKLGPPVLRLVPKEYLLAITLISDIAKKYHVDAISGGLPGPLNKSHTKLLQSTHLPSWVEKPFVRDLQRQSGARVFLENDSALVALGEAVFGAGKNNNIVAYIGFGTGIGGARIVDQRIDVNAMGFEPGHHIVDWNITKHRHQSPHPGDWESFVSGTGIFIATGKRSENVANPKIWSLAERRTAIGLINVAMFWSPDVIVLGGSLMKKMSLQNIQQEFRTRMKIFPHPPNIRCAKLGDFSGLYGALALANRTKKI